MAASPLHVSVHPTHARGWSEASHSITLGLGILRGLRLQWKSVRCGRGQIPSFGLVVLSSKTPLRLVDLDLDLAEGCLEHPWQVVPGKVGGSVSAQWVCAWPFQALEKKGISHLEEKELKERNKRIQEDNRLELQKVGLPLACLHGVRRPSLVRA